MDVTYLGNDISIFHSQFQLVLPRGLALSDSTIPGIGNESVEWNEGLKVLLPLPLLSPIQVRK